jgi:hypothetical protein
LFGTANIGLADAAVAATIPAPQSGYWWLPEPIAGLIPVPGVPAGGIYVSSTPTGAEAISAVRIPLSADAHDVRLTLRVSALTKINPLAIDGYPATGDWPTGGPQPWSARPEYRSTSKPAVGVFDAADTTMTITFPASEATAGIVLVPATTQMLAPTFSVSFAPVTASDIAVLGIVQPTAPSPIPNPATHRPTHSPVASKTPSASASPSPRRSAKASPSQTTSRRPRPSTGTPTSPSGATSSHPLTGSTVTASGDTSGHGLRDTLVVVAIVIVALAVSLLLWRRRSSG